MSHVLALPDSLSRFGEVESAREREGLSDIFYNVGRVVQTRVDSGVSKDTSRKAIY